jgi:hypothetical protein
VLVQDIVRDLNAHLLTTSEPQIPAAELGLVIRVFGDAVNQIKNNVHSTQRSQSGDKIRVYA